MEKMNTTKNPEIILVLGMHRSGTSLVSQLIARSGVYLGNNLMPANRSNTDGYWEDERLVELNDQILAGVNSAWLSPPALNYERELSVLNEEIKSRAVDLISEMDREGRTWCWKDPRFPVLLEFWGPLLSGRSLTCVVPVRNPVAIAHSLLSRDSIPVTAGLLIWERTYLELLNFTRNNNRTIFVDYDKLVTDPFNQVNHFSDCLSKMTGLAISDKEKGVMHAVVKPDLRHHIFDMDCDVMTPSQIDLHEHLQKLCRGGTVKAIKPGLYAGWKEYLHSVELKKKYKKLIRQYDHRHLDIKRLRKINESLDVKNRELIEAKKTFELKNRELIEVRKSVESKNRELIEANKAYERKNQGLIKENQVLAGRNRQFAKKNTALLQQMSSVAKENNKLKAEQDLIYTSKSWIFLNFLRRVAAWMIPVAHPLKTIGLLKASRIIRESGLWDRKYYLETYFKTVRLKQYAIIDYLFFGVERKRNPNPLFDTGYYLEKNPDVARSDINPLVHFIKFGANEGRNPNPLFDTGYYLEKNPDVARSDINPLVHFIKFGANEGRNPGPLFDTRYYLEMNPDVLQSNINPLYHYIFYGKKEGRCSFPPSRGQQGGSDKKAVGPGIGNPGKSIEQETLPFVNFSEYCVYSFFNERLHSPYSGRAQRVISFMDSIRKVLRSKYLKLPQDEFGFNNSTGIQS